MGRTRLHPTPITAFTRPTAPAAGSVWPMQDFMAERTSAVSRESCVCSTSTAWAAPTSIGSPSGVPVPCISRPSTAPGSVLADPRQLRITRCCEGPLGAVRELERPSWFTADATKVLE